MLLDILIGVPILIFILLGVRDGVVRKLVAIVVIIAGLFLGQLYMHPVGNFLAERGVIDQEDASMNGYLIIFLGLFIIQSLLYKVLTKNYKIGGIADRIGGTILGFFEGALWISSLLLIFAMSGFPDRETKRDTRFYKPIVNIAPQILDMTSSLGPEVLEKLKEVGTSGSFDKGKEKKDIHRSTKTSTEPNKK
jgi:uncharacterized membrane protein required for colicin V production